MNLKEKILADMKEAMKAKDSHRLEVLRFLQSAVRYKEIELRPGLINEAEIIGVVTKQVKQRKESIDQFDKAGRKDLVDKEKYELSVLEGYLPHQMNRAEVEEVVETVIKTLNATSMKQMGAVIKEVLAKTAGSADGKLVSEIVKAKFQ
ncbi:MAG: GatB/YqeY domain-containing protein [Bdellovibrionales bacterium]|nr:GatB/YqeY domain-containing protein [Bdellovibrionales bacterium]